MAGTDEVVRNRLTADLVGFVAILERAGQIQLECAFEPHLTESKKVQIEAKFEAFAEERFRLY